jgi:hypothetical protein
MSGDVRGMILAVTTFLSVAGVAAGARADDGACVAVAQSNPAWHAVDQQYGKLERAQLAKDPKALFALYAPDFEAHNRDGSVWKFSQSADYSAAGFADVKQNIHLSDTIVGMVSCSPSTVKATVIQQWTRMQDRDGKVTQTETVTVQDETWVRTPGGWLRKLVDNVRPGAWYVDGKRVSPDVPYRPDEPVYDPHGLATPASGG